MRRLVIQRRTCTWYKYTTRGGVVRNGRGAWGGVRAPGQNHGVKSGSFFFCTIFAFIGKGLMYEVRCGLTECGQCFQNRGTHLFRKLNRVM